MPQFGHLDASAFLRTEHAAVRVLAAAESEAQAFPALIEAIAGEFGGSGRLWAPGEDADELIAEAWASGRPAARPDAFAIPIAGAGVMAFTLAAPLEPDALLDATLESLGTQMSGFVTRCRAQDALRQSDARKTAILDAAFDCVITMDHDGKVLEVNRAVERTFGYDAEEMIGHELAALIVPPSLREYHRNGLVRYLRTRQSEVSDKRLEAIGMRKDGSEFPIELIVTEPDMPGPTIFCGYLRDVTEARGRERDLRRLADEQAALRRVATAVAASTDPRHAFGVVTEEVARLLRAQSATMVRFDGPWALVLGVWNAPGVTNVPVGATASLDGDSAAARVYRTGAPARIEEYEPGDGALSARLRSLGFHSAVAAPIFLDGGLWGAMIVSSVEPKPFKAGAEQRLADFAELAAQALSNAQAREELAASRARIVQAGDAERRRLERNLHDGAQQRLVSLALMLRLASRRHPGDEELAQAGEELTHALQELRELARGIHPAVLTDRGLEPAVRALADRTPLPVEIDVQIHERLPDPVEAAAYYVVAEALTNVAKYAHATEVCIGVVRQNFHALIEVRDDGVGGASADEGSGLRGLADRIEALGGRLVVDSPIGVGTTLRAEIPCAASV